MLRFSKMCGVLETQLSKIWIWFWQWLGEQIPSKVEVNQNYRCPYLKAVKMDNFTGAQYEVEFLLHLLKHVVSVEKIIIQLMPLTDWKNKKYRLLCLDCAQLLKKRICQMHPRAEVIITWFNCKSLIIDRLYYFIYAWNALLILLKNLNSLKKKVSRCTCIYIPIQNEGVTSFKYELKKKSLLVCISLLKMSKYEQKGLKTLSKTSKAVCAVLVALKSLLNPYLNQEHIILYIYIYSLIILEHRWKSSPIYLIAALSFNKLSLCHHEVQMSLDWLIWNCKITE